jgi:hypothetical protein
MAISTMVAIMGETPLLSILSPPPFFLRNNEKGSLKRLGQGQGGNVEGKLVVRHVVGDEIPKAFRLSNGAVTWVNPFPAGKPVEHAGET